MHIIGNVLSDIWWGVVAYVCAVQVHNAIVHVGNALAVMAAAQKTESERRWRAYDRSGDCK